MVKFLLDTNVVCEPHRQQPDASCVAWLQAQIPGAIATSTITLAEIWQGVLDLDIADKRRPLLTRFAENLPQAFRLLTFDERAAKTWGELTRRGQQPLPFRDSLIAAIALTRKLTVVTPNA